MGGRRTRVAAATLAELPDAWVNAWPTLEAAADRSGSVTFAELARGSAEWAAALWRHGFGPGSRVVLWGANSATWLVRAFGVWRAGCTLVPLSTFVTGRELQEILGSARPDLLLMDRRVGEKDLVAPLRDAVLPPSLQRIVVDDCTGMGDAQGADEFLAAARGSEWRENLARPEAVAAILYTSGTTGLPKGVRLQHRAVLSTVGPTVVRGGLRPGDRVLSTLPLFWVAGLCIRALPTLASGAALLLIDAFTVEKLLAALRRWAPTGLHLRPPQVAALLAHPDFDGRLLQGVRRGGGRKEWYRGHLDRARLITGYGMTEMSGYVAALSWRDPDEVRAHSLGKLLPGVEVRIVGEDGQECRPGDVGEIRVRGPGLFDGYEGQPPRTALDSSGFFCTGDLGVIDSQGDLHFVGRSKDLLRCKGVNVSPVEVESVLLQHPDIEAAVVVGLPPEALDQELVAVVVPRDGQNREHEWREWCRSMLSPYKRPSVYVTVRREEIPLGATSKPQRKAVAELVLARLGTIRPAST